MLGQCLSIIQLQGLVATPGCFTLLRGFHFPWPLSSAFISWTNKDANKHIVHRGEWPGGMCHGVTKFQATVTMKATTCGEGCCVEEDCEKRKLGNYAGVKGADETNDL